jgi:hypothetical protein
MTIPSRAEQAAPIHSSLVKKASLRHMPRTASGEESWLKPVDFTPDAAHKREAIAARALAGGLMAVGRADEAARGGDDLSAFRRRRTPVRMSSQNGSRCEEESLSMAASFKESGSTGRETA